MGVDGRVRVERAEALRDALGDGAALDAAPTLVEVVVA